MSLSGTGRVLTAKGVTTVTLTLKHWENKPMATLTADEAENLGYELIKYANEVRYDASERALAAKLVSEDDAVCPICKGGECTAEPGCYDGADIG